MAWIDDLNELHAWLAQPGEVRVVRVRLTVLAATGHAYYAEGVADLGGGSITGQLDRHQNEKRWNPPPLGDAIDNFPFDPATVDKIALNINLSNGAITVGSTTYAQPTSLAGANLVTADVIAGSGVMRQLSLSLLGQEQKPPT